MTERAMGIRDKPTASASPWQNGFAERLIGSIRREYADHIIVFGEAHLRRILRSYAGYYNGIRTHRSLDKDAPISGPVQRTGVINSQAILGGLRHHYARKFSVHTHGAIFVNRAKPRCPIVPSLFWAQLPGINSLNH
jgi:hypothetical protein